MQNPGYIEHASIEGDLIQIRFSDQSPFSYHPLWLRDRCTCDLCIDSDSRQKLFTPSKLHADLYPTNLEYESTEIKIVWSDDHQSHYSSKWLGLHTPEGISRRIHHPILWDSSLYNCFPEFDYSEVKTSDNARFQLLKSILDYGVARIKDVSDDPDQTEILAGLISIIRETTHGRIYDVRSIPNAHNLAYNSDELSMHMDGSYHYYTPGPILFHFIETTKTGGESLLVDGFKVADTLRNESPMEFELLTQLPWQNVYANAGMDLRSSQPVIGMTSDGSISHIIINQYSSFPLQPKPDQAELAYSAWRNINAIAERPELKIQFKVEAGDALVFDNRRVLHSRTAFNPTAEPRRLRHCYMDRDTLHSNLRILAAKFGDPIKDAIFTTN